VANEPSDASEQTPGVELEDLSDQDQLDHIKAPLPLVFRDKLLRAPELRGHLSLGKACTLPSLNKRTSHGSIRGVKTASPKPGVVSWL
jgi:hypothetical protein